jgi:endonuclease-3
MKKMTDKIIQINELLVQRFGIPKRNKKLPDPVNLLIATILSQNTNDNNSYKAFKNLKKRFPKWEDILAARRTSIEKEIRVAGLGKQKSEAIKNFVKELHQTKGKISLQYLKKLENEKALEDLTSYKGIGVKTASCALLFSLDRNVCPVDTHVHRTTNRIGLVKEKTPDKTFFTLNKNFPPNIAHSFHTNLIRLGREICKPKNPACGICPLKKVCEFNNKNLNSINSSAQRDFMLLDNVEN